MQGVSSVNSVSAIPLFYPQIGRCLHGVYGVFNRFLTRIGQDTSARSSTPPFLPAIGFPGNWTQMRHSPLRSPSHGLGHPRTGTENRKIQTGSSPTWLPSEPEVWFRIIHIAQEGNNSSPVADYREQTVEITLGPKGTFEIGDIALVTRRKPTWRQGTPFFPAEFPVPFRVSL